MFVLIVPIKYVLNTYVSDILNMTISRALRLIDLICGYYTRITKYTSESRAASNTSNKDVIY